MDNRIVDVASDNDDDLRATLSILWKNCPGGFAKYYGFIVGKDGTKALVLSWSEGGGITTQPLAYPHDFEAALAFIKGWLKQAEFPPHMGIDGSEEPGWRMYCEGWGHVNASSYAFVAVQPEWALYGK